MRVLIVDDHTLVRAGIRRLLEGFEGVEVAGEAGSAQEALDLVALRHPDIVLLDLSMPGRNGFEVLAELRATAPSARVVIMSMHDDPLHVREALDRGASGFVVKEAAPAELEVALRAAAAGQTFLSPQVSARMLQPMLRHRDRPGGMDALSPRQREILRGLGRGLGNKEIASELGISVKTVETHRARLMEALGCRRASELLRLAVQLDAGLGG